MKLSKLIGQLQEILDKEGDKNVFMKNTCLSVLDADICEMDNISPIEPVYNVDDFSYINEDKLIIVGDWFEEDSYVTNTIEKIKSNINEFTNIADWARFVAENDGWDEFKIEHVEEYQDEDGYSMISARINTTENEQFIYTINKDNLTFKVDHIENGALVLDTDWKLINM